MQALKELNKLGIMLQTKIQLFETMAPGKRKKLGE